MKQIREVLVDLYGCDVNLDDIQFLTEVLTAAAVKMKTKVIRTLSHKFSPAGATVIIVLAETHLSIHTWPEHGYAALDIFICSEEVDPTIGWHAIKEALKPSSFKIHMLTRRIESARE